MPVTEKPMRALLLTCVFCFSVTALAQDDLRRLIQTAPNKTQWMTDSAINEYSRQMAVQKRQGGYMDITEHQNKVRSYLPLLPFLDRGEPHAQKIVNRLLPELSAERMMETIAKLSLFRTRYYQSESGVSAAAWIRDQFAAMARGRSDVTIELVTHSFKQPSVIARINGKFWTRPSESVIVGGHEDSIGSSLGFPAPNEMAPGADDNASGIATMMEVFRVLTSSGFVPDRTIEFIAYAGEERGLLGSQDIAQKYASQGRSVVGVLQLDMTMFPGPNPAISMVNDFVNPELTKFTEALIDTYVNIPWREIACGYACSDHASWDEAGYPAAYPFESDNDNYNPHIHTTDDTASWLNSAFGLHFAKLALSFAIELSTAP